MAKYVSRGRYYLTADKARVVAEGDPAAAFLYVTAGREVDADEAQRLGLLDLDQPAAKAAPAETPAEPESEAAPEPEPAPEPEAKAVHKAAVEDKAVDGPKAKRER